MALTALPRGDRFASPTTFAAALDMFKAADAALDRFGRTAAAEYGEALNRLIAMPAPDVAGLAAKIAAADPTCLDHHFAILQDARRLAAGHE